MWVDLLSKDGIFKLTCLCLSYVPGTQIFSYAG